MRSYSLVPTCKALLNSLSQKLLFVHFQPVKPISAFLLITFTPLTSAVQWASVNSEISKLNQTSKSDTGDVTMGKETI